jgi:hypothetical protein
MSHYSESDLYVRTGRVWQNSDHPVESDGKFHVCLSASSFHSLSAIAMVVDSELIDALCRQQRVHPRTAPDDLSPVAECPPGSVDRDTR